MHSAEQVPLASPHTSHPPEKHHTLHPPENPLALHSQGRLKSKLCGVTEQGPLSSALTSACVERYESSKDAHFLLPAIPGMQRPAVLQIFPRLLDLGAGQFKTALHRLMMPLPSSGGLRTWPSLYLTWIVTWDAVRITPSRHLDL